MEVGPLLKVKISVNRENLTLENIHDSVTKSDEAFSGHTAFIKTLLFLQQLSVVLFNASNQAETIFHKCKLD